MASINTLPQELLFALLNCIDSVAHLAQCRLVSKAWNEPATRAMLGKKITIKSDKDAFKLYRHLFRDSSKLSLVKHLHFELSGNDLPFIIEELLQSTFTPSIQRLTGSVKADKFFTTLFDIAGPLPSRFDQLEELPTYTGASQAIFDQRLLKFASIHKKFTLTIVRTTTSTVVWSDEFHKFQHLTTFTLKGIPHGMLNIELVIKRCHHLKTLNLQDIDYGGQTMTRMTTEEVTSWATSNVCKEKTLETLNIKALCRPELIEYLVFKYPNVANITIEGRLWYPENDLAAAHKTLEIILPSTITFNIANGLLSDSDAIALTVKVVGSQYQLVMNIN
ncbi:hypothetical protein MBANPS3_012211 [Mucor bainieri]